MIDFLVGKLTKRLFGGDVTVFVEFNRINHVVIGDAALDNIVQVLHRSALTAVNDIVKPFQVIAFKALIAVARQGLCPINVKFEGIQDRDTVSMSAGDGLRPRRCLLAKPGEIEALPKIDPNPASFHFGVGHLHV